MTEHQSAGGTLLPQRDIGYVVASGLKAEISAEHLHRHE